MQLEQLDLRELLRKSPAEVRDSLMRAEIHFVTVHLQSSFPGWSLLLVVAPEGYAFQRTGLPTPRFMSDVLARQIDFATISHLEITRTLLSEDAKFREDVFSVLGFPRSYGSKGNVASLELVESLDSEALSHRVFSLLTPTEWVGPLVTRIKAYAAEFGSSFCFRARENEDLSTPATLEMQEAFFSDVDVQCAQPAERISVLNRKVSNLKTLTPLVDDWRAQVRSWVLSQGRIDLAPAYYGAGLVSLKGRLYRTLLDARLSFLCLHSAPEFYGTVQRFLATQSRSGGSFGGMGLGIFGRLNSYVASIEERYKSLSSRIGN